MTKKNRAKSKAKRFGEGSARTIVDASTYGAGNAFASAFSTPAAPPRKRGRHGRAPKAKPNIFAAR